MICCKYVRKCTTPLRLNPGYIIKLDKISSSVTSRGRRRTCALMAAAAMLAKAEMDDTTDKVNQFHFIFYIVVHRLNMGVV